MDSQMYSDEKIQEVFDSFDADGSGRLEMAELKNALNLLNIDLTDEEMKSMYNIDDDPESLTFEEFRSFIKDRVETMGIDFYQRLVDAIKEFSDDGERGDEQIITNEMLRQILTARGNNPISEEEADELIEQFDENKDGYFNVEELARFLTAVME